MAQYPQKLSDKKFQNYIKEGLALLVAKEGLEDFVLDVVTRQKNDILQHIYNNNGVQQGDICTSCKTESIIPCQTKGICKIYRNRCKFHGQNVPTPCPKSICSSFMDFIHRDHEYRRPSYEGPSWKNTDASQWCVDPYSFAKCYMPPDGYLHVKSLQETDFNGIIAVIINNKRFDTSKISNLSKKNLQQVREIGRFHRHSPDLSIQDSDLAKNLDTLIDLLNDPVCLKGNTNAQRALQTLQQIKSGSLTITPDDITRVLEKVIEMKTKEVTKEGKDKIDKYTESKMENVKEEITKFTGDKSKDASEEITEHARKKTKESLLDIESKTANSKEDIDKHATRKKKITMKQIDEHAESRTKDFKEEISQYTKSNTKEAKDNLDKYAVSKLSEADLEIDGHANRKIKDAEEEIDHHVDSKTKEAREAIDTYVESRTKKEESKIDGHAERTIEHAKTHLKQFACSKAIDMKEDFDKHADIKTKEAMELIREQTQNAKEEIDEKILSVISELQKMKMIISEMSTHEIADIFHPTASELQRHLLELYKQSSYYLKTEVSPFLPDEEEYLDDVFVQPMITRKIKTIPNDEKPVESYEDFFTFGKTRFKNIILTADPGMGKTAICKRIISLWCEAHQPNDGQYAVREYTNKHRDIETMKKIKFLFYVSLPHSPPDVKSIEEMIRRQLLDTGHYQTLRSVLENEPENCLVMLDGFDEWTAPNTTTSSPRIPPGLPDREVKSQYTTILATRPFKLEKIGPFQSDVEIKLHALDKQRIKEHIQSIYAKLDIYCTMNSAEVYDELKKRNVDNLLNVPLILKMIICLFIDDKTIHESITGIYMCITETLLDRASQKVIRSDTKQTENPGAKLPECFKEQTKCKELADILIQLSELSFDLLFKQGKKSVFNIKSSDPRFPGLSQCLQIGLLSKASLRGRSAKDRYASVSFIHETFQEFFSALSISVFDTDENIELVLKNCDTLVSFLGLNRFFMFVSEMNAPLLKRVCEHVADIVDTRMDGFRNMENTTLIWPYNDSCTCLLEAVQVGITNCIGQILNDKRLSVNIRDIFIDTTKNIIAPIENIVPESVTSMHICQTKEIPKKVVDFLHTCSKVRCIWYYKPSFRVKWQELFPDVNLFERFTYLDTLYLRKCNIGHTAVSAILLHPNIKNVNFNEIHSRKDGECTCSAIHGRQTETQRKAATKINTLCIVQSSEVLTHVDAACNLQTLVWDHSEPCFSNAKTISNFLSTSSSLRTVTIRGLNTMKLSADKDAIIDRICVELSRLRSLENLKLEDCNLSSYQESMLQTLIK